MKTNDGKAVSGPAPFLHWFSSKACWISGLVQVLGIAIKRFDSN
ncbi:hypothetical protein [Kroppenstedtia pulmonis]|nr:hypothetical protein [Kroppenstedtia pulmonis]